MGLILLPGKAEYSSKTDVTIKTTSLFVQAAQEQPRPPTGSQLARQWLSSHKQDVTKQ